MKSTENQRLTGKFYHRETTAVARELLGKLLVRRLPSGARLSGIIVEVEAYLAAGDPASHSFRGPGRKNASMFKTPGTLYTYSIHARHCANIVTEPSGVGAAVLIRAIEPLENLALMHQYRGTDNIRLLSTGPARLCQALQLDRQHDGLDLSTNSEVWLEAAPKIISTLAWNISCSPRIGISQAQELELRFFVDGNKFVSGRSRDHLTRPSWGFTLNR